MINKAVFFAIILFAGVQAQWGYISSYPMNIRVYDVTSAGPDARWYCSDNGALYRTIDNGASYKLVSTDVLTRILCLNFINSSNGFAGANDGYLLRTTDAGATWQSTRPFPGKNISHIKFISSQTGFMLTGTNEIHKTTNAGLTWTSYPLPSGFIPFRIAFYDENTGLLTSSSSMLRTTNGGSTWTTVALLPNVRSVCIVNPQLTFAGGDSARIYKSTDKGLTWNFHFKAPQYNSQYIDDIAFADGNRGIFMANYSIYITTIDGGNSFTVTSRPWFLNSFNKLFLDKVNDIYFVEKFGFMSKSTDFGVNWSGHSVRYPYQLFSSDNAKSGFITVGQSGFIVFQNNFTGFEQMPVFTTQTLRSVSYSGYDSGWIVGDSGTIILAGKYSSDWRLQTSGVTANLRSVHRHPSLGIAGVVGENGTFLWTSNSGFLWTKKPTPVTTDLNAVCLISDKAAIVVGDGGIILRTTNSGDNWTVIPSGTTQNLLTVHSAENIVMIGGKGGQTIRSLDSGKTWGSNNISISQDIISFKFINKLLVRFLTSGGKTFVSSNSGISWRNEFVFPEDDITSFAFSGTGYSIATRKAGYVLMDVVALPVELTLFSADVQGTEILLTWSTASEINNRGFEIQKSTDNVNWNAIGFTGGQGTTTLTNKYTFRDKYPDVGKNYYRLRQSDYDGKSEYSSVVEAGYYSAYYLGENYPNPFNPQTNIVYTIPFAGHTTIEIFDALGNKVDVPVNAYQESGTHTFVYNASVLSSGIYLYRLQSGSFAQTKRMMVLK